MSIRLYNTLTQKVEPFEPLLPGTARVYLCGLTTYDLAHAGHARTNTTFDVLVRHLRARGLKVVYCRNVTDVDDKILARAKENGEDPLALSARMADAAGADLTAIGCATPDHEPRVSTHLAEIVKLIEALVAKGLAYVAEAPNAKGGKDVYFAVRSFPEYGKLSHRNVDDLQAGARVEVGEAKRDPLDFALWKGEPEEGWGWPSPWGKGRPGWHIECSAMASRYLGEHFDIHGGGMDLIFPHHENEIAQSEGAWGPPFARVWMHGGFLNLGEKMSKSLGNFFTIRDVLARNDPEAFRYYLLGTHYHGPLSFEIEKKEDGRVIFLGIQEAEGRMDYLYSTRAALLALAEGAEPAIGNVLQGQATIVADAAARVLAALDNDLNTPQALSVIAELAKASNEIVMQAAKLKKDKAKHDAVRALAAAAVHALDGSVKPLGLMQASPDTYAERTRTRRLALRNLAAADIDAKVRARTDARAAKDFARADALRAELAALGVEVYDAGTTTSWRILP